MYMMLPTALWQVQKGDVVSSILTQRMSSGYSLKGEHIHSTISEKSEGIP